MSQTELLKRSVAALEAAAIPYLLTGSLASSLQGAPRATHDIDLVISVERPGLPRLLVALRTLGLSFDAGAVAEAVGSRSMFNLIDAASGDKIDFWLLTDDAYDRCRFERRQVVEALGGSLVVSAPEDTILMKLRWLRNAGGSKKQLADAVAVFELQGETLDQSYLDDWAARLGVTDLLAQVRASAGPLEGQAGPLED